MAVSDEQAIRNLIFTYAERIDAGDIPGMAQLFAHATFAGGDGPPVTGAEPVERMNRALVILYEDGTPRTQHVTSNVRIRLDAAAGAARADSRFTVFQQVPGHPLEPIVAGRYEDAFERGPDGWRFASRRVRVELVGDLSRHLRLERLPAPLG